jgi:hypothetical protein
VTDPMNLRPSIHQVVVTTSRLAGSLTEALSFDRAPLRGVPLPNSATVCGAEILLTGIGFAPFASLSSRIGFSTCHATDWVSISTLRCRFAQNQPDSVPHGS